MTIRYPSSDNAPHGRIRVSHEDGRWYVPLSGAAFAKYEGSCPMRAVWEDREAPQPTGPPATVVTVPAGPAPVATGSGPRPADELELSPLRPSAGRMSGVNVAAVRGDITVQRVDAIVNAANGSLRRGAGVCGAIFAAAGPELDDACAAIGSCDTGDAVVTPGFALPARFVVHTVGPVWHGGDRNEPELLASCYRRSLAVAREAGARSIAFPAISTGIYGYPPRQAAEIATATVRQSEEAAAFDAIELVAFDEATFRLYVELLAGE